ncbi:MAG: deoxyhypusine synthase family protein [Planctomycetaceae bacterium]|nr:deoxyhypusine synthase family protein [Planctomycetaceae bacterium]
MQHDCPGRKRQLHDGQGDGLIPLESLDLSQTNSFAELLRAMSKTAFSGRQLGEAFDVLTEMSRNEKCSIVLTISGAMTVAKQGRIFCELIDRGIVNCVVATGALIAHGLSESIGMTHYRYEASDSDEQLFEQGYNRIYDTLEMESNLNHVEQMIRKVLNQTETPARGWSSARICKEIGRELSKQDQGVGILRSAYQQNVPVFIPAFTDSEIGLDFSTWAMKNHIDKNSLDASSLSPEEVFSQVPPFNPFIDLQQYAQFISECQQIGIFTIGGGVPRNWAQQVGPYFDITNDRLGTTLTPPKFQYGVRICPEPVHWGGLSGCTYTEGVSWGKFVPPNEGGRYAEVYSDATVVLPLLIKALCEELDA